MRNREGADRPERRTALVAMELTKYNIDIAALCETMFSESGSLNDLEYSFFWSGKPKGERREAGVGFAIKNYIVTKLTEMLRPLSDRIITMRLPLSKAKFATIISVYVPTTTNPDENKEAFNNQLASVLIDIPHTCKLLLIGDFNARIGREHDKWPLVMGKHGIGKCNSNGELLLALCSEFEIIMTNTMFKQKDERYTTPRSRHCHMIDFIITRCRDKMDIHSTRTMRGANCWTGHQILRSKVAFRIRQKHNRQGTSNHTKMPADCYKNAPVHWSQTGGKGKQWSCRELLTVTTWRVSTIDWRKCGNPKRRDLFNWTQQMEWRPSLTARELWQDGVNTSRSYSISLAT